MSLLSLRPNHALVFATLVAAGCNALWGLDALDYSAAANAGAAASVGGGGTGAGLGAAGGAGAQGGAAGTGGAGLEPCSPGESRSCYSGPVGTEGIGPCASGIQHCNELGSAFGPCLGEVLPAREICLDGVDQDCNGTDSTLCLLGDELVLRYPIDEAASGQAPTELRDTSPSPMPLPLLYGEALSYDEDGSGHRGLRWMQLDAAGGALTSSAPTKLTDALGGSSEATVELVVDVEESSASGSPLLYVGVGVSGGHLALWAYPHGYRFYWHAGLLIGAWSSSGTAGRRVVHAVLETTAATAGDRIRCYEDGQLLSVEPMVMETVAEGDTIELPGAIVGIGNRNETSAQSPKGTIYYAAIYASALTSAEIEANVTALLEGDDGT